MSSTMKEARPGRGSSSSSRGRGRTGGRGAVPRRSVAADDANEGSTSAAPKLSRSLSGEEGGSFTEKRVPKTRVSQPSGGGGFPRRSTGTSVPPRLRDLSSHSSSSNSLLRRQSFESNKGGSASLQIKTLSNKLFPVERDQELLELTTASLPHDSDDALSFLKILQDSLGDNIKSRMELVETSIEIERKLATEYSEMQALNTQNNEIIDELTTSVQSLKLDKSTAVNAVENRWRTRLDAETERFRKMEEELRRSLAEKGDEREQLLYVNMANERKISDLSTRASLGMATQIAESSNTRQRDEECDRLRSEVSRLTGVLESKSNEVSVAMVTFAEMQRMTVEREGELKAKLTSAESKVEELMKELAEEKKNGMSIREELLMKTSETSSLQGRLVDYERNGGGHGHHGLSAMNHDDIVELKSKLAVETSLKERAEMREASERMERVATNAQLIAVEQSKTHALEQARLEFQKRERKLVAEVEEFNDRISSISVSMKEMQDLNERLEAEKRTLARNLDRMKVNNPHQMGGDHYPEDSEDGDGGSQSDFGGLSPAARRRQMIKNKKAGKNDPNGENEPRGLWARIRNKKERPVEIYQSKGGGRNVGRSSHQPAEQHEGRDGGEYSDGGDSDGVYNEEDLGEQMLTSESYSDSDAQQSGKNKASASSSLKRGGSSREGGGGDSEALTAARASLAAAQSQLAAQADAAIAQAKEMADLAGANDDLQRRVNSLEKENQALKDALERTKQECADSLVELTNKVREGETQRRKMHNLIQELRGNVRVFARVRPFLPEDKVKAVDPKPWLRVRADGVTLDVMEQETTAKGTKMGDKSQYTFEYDKSFDPSQGQEDIFIEVSEFVQSALDGYNVCLFSYGQTGSGKTHTMQGVGSGAMRGIIPRAVQQVAEYKAKLEEQGWVWTMKVSFVEIYCEKIRDLLKKDGKKGAELEHKIIRNDYGANEISNVQMVEVDPADDDAIEHLMHIAAQARATRSTDMNATSSRSHSVFTLHLSAENAKLDANIAGQLNLCDLAGSERVDRSGAKGVSLTEAKNINKSLAALAHVFESISKQAAHVPFRDSTLTYLLEPALSGNGKTLMIINLSPTEMSVNESVSTLRFGAKVNKVELGKPKRQIGQGKAKDKESKKH